MRVSLTLLTDAAEMLLRRVQGTIHDDHEAGEKRVTIRTTVPKLLEGIEDSSMLVHAYFPTVGEPSRSRGFLQRAREDLAAANASQGVGVEQARDAVRLWEAEVARVEAIATAALEVRDEVAAADEDRLLAALTRAVAAAGAKPYDHVRFVTSLVQDGYTIAMPDFRGQHWLEATVDEGMINGGDAASMLAVFAEDGARFVHRDDPTPEDLLLRGVSDAALRREVLRRGLDLDAPEPATGPTP